MNHQLSEDDDRLAELLAAYHDALTGRTDPQISPGHAEQLDARALKRFRKAQACLDLLDSTRHAPPAGRDGKSNRFADLANAEPASGATGAPINGGGLRETAGSQAESSPERELRFPL